MSFRLPVGLVLSFSRPVGMKSVPTPSSDAGLSPR